MNFFKFLVTYLFSIFILSFIDFYSYATYPFNVIIHWFMVILALPVFIFNTSNFYIGLIFLLFFSGLIFFVSLKISSLYKGIILIIYLLCCKFWVGIYPDNEFNRLYTFIKYRPIWKTYFYSTNELGNIKFNQLSDENKIEQLLYEEFVLNRD